MRFTTPAETTMTSSQRLAAVHLGEVNVRTRSTKLAVSSRFFGRAVLHRELRYVLFARRQLDCFKIIVVSKRLYLTLLNNSTCLKMNQRDRAIPSTYDETSRVCGNLIVERQKSISAGQIDKSDFKTRAKVRQIRSSLINLFA